MFDSQHAHALFVFSCRNCESYHLRLYLVLREILYTYILNNPSIIWQWYYIIFEVIQLGLWSQGRSTTTVNTKQWTLSNCLIRYLKIPIVIAGLMVLMSCYLVLAPIIDKPTLEYLYCTIFIFSGLILYYFFIYRRVKWAHKVTSKFTLNFLYNIPIVSWPSA